MPELLFGPPNPDQYPPHMAGYVASVGARDPIALARGQIARLGTALEGLSDERALYRYAPGKWSIKEVLGHITDCERVFAYRLLRIVRGDTTPLPGFEQDPYVENAEFDGRSLSDLAEDLRSVRHGTIRLIDSVQPDAWGRAAVVSGSPTTAKALLYVIAGHAEHHLVVLNERYEVKVRLDG